MRTVLIGILIGLAVDLPFFTLNEETDSGPITLLLLWAAIAVAIGVLHVTRSTNQRRGRRR